MRYMDSKNQKPWEDDWTFDMPEFRSFYNYGRKDAAIEYFDENRIFHRMTDTNAANIKNEVPHCRLGIHDLIFHRALNEMREGMTWCDLYELIRKIRKEDQKKRDQVWHNMRLNPDEFEFKPYYGLSKLSNNKTGYFDENGIYHIVKLNGLSIHLENTISICENRNILYDRYSTYYIGSNNAAMFRKVVRQLKEGDTWEIFCTMAREFRNQKPDPKPKDEIAECIGKIGDVKIQRNPGNNNKKTFDFIQIVLYLVRKENMPEILKKYKHMFQQIATEKVTTSKIFQQYKVPENFLKCSSIRYNKQYNELRFTYELKISSK